MSVWKFLHISAMFGAAAVVIGQEILVHLIRRPGTQAAVRLLPEWDRFANLVAAPLFFGGVGLGFVTAITSGFRLTAPWLVTAYVLVAAMILNAVFMWDPLIRRLKSAVAEGDAHSSAARGILHSPRLKISAVVDALLWVAIIFTMVLKPFT